MKKRRFSWSGAANHAIKATNAGSSTCDAQRAKQQDGEIGPNVEVSFVGYKTEKTLININKELNKGLIIYKELRAKSGIEESYSLLAKLFEKKGDYKMAFEYHKLYVDLKDSTLNEQSSKQIAEMNAKYENEKKEIAHKRYYSASCLWILALA